MLRAHLPVGRAHVRREEDTQPRLSKCEAPSAVEAANIGLGGPVSCTAREG